MAPLLLGLLLMAFLSCMAHADALDDTIKAQMLARHIPGLSLAVVKAGKVMTARGYGLADLEHNVPATPDTVYEIGSLTKQFTATAVMMLVEDGKIDLDAKISRYLPDLPAAWDAVTVRHLLTHTSGIPNYTDLADIRSRMRVDITHQDLIALMAPAPLQFAPGEKWAYSNTNYFLLGMILEAVSGQSYGALLEARIFHPLGMTATRVNDLGMILPNRACGYTRERETWRHAEFTSMTWPFAAGVLVSTVRDMAKWDAVLYGKKLLKPSSLNEMWTRVKLNDGTTADYGFGWAISDVRGHHEISHGGGIPGFVTQISRFVDDKLTVIVFTNTDKADPDAIAQLVAGLSVPALTPLPPVPPKVIPDGDSQTTQHLRAVVQEIEDGHADPAQFTPEAQALLFPTRIQQASGNLKRLGPLNSFQPVQQTTVNKQRDYRYEAMFGETPLYIHFVLTEDGKISLIQLTSE